MVWSGTCLCKLIQLCESTGLFSMGVVHAGSVRRQSTDRVTRLSYDQPGAVLACQTTGKLLDFFKYAAAVSMVLR